MNTHNPIVIGSIDGKLVIVAEGKGRNKTVVSYDGKSCSHGYIAVAHGQEVAEIYAAYHAANHGVILE